MQETRSPSYFVFAALLGLLFAPVMGCSLGLDFDRSKIKDGNGSDSGIDGGPGHKDAGPDKDASTMKDAAADATTSDSGSDATVPGDAGKDSGPGEAGEDAGWECKKASECGTDTVCRKFACTDHECVTTDVAAGALPSGMQVAGDCKTLGCDGQGALTTVANTSDLPTDDNDCADYACNGSTLTMTFVGVNTGCTRSGGGGGKCDGSGSCVQCIVKADCGTDTACVTYSCNGSNACVTTYVNGAAASQWQTANNCKVISCDGSGNPSNDDDNSDKPLDDGNQCTNDDCAAGSQVHPNKSDGATCNQNGGTHCNDGLCKACGVDADCGASDDCTTFTCNQTPGASLGTCNTSYAGTDVIPSTGQTQNDCHALHCDGGGGTTSQIDDGDAPVSDNDPCTSDACLNGVPYPAAPDTTRCGPSDSKYCDGNKNCVECNLDSQCTPQICISHACIDNGSLTMLSVTPASLVAGATGDVSVSFRTAGPWASNGVLSLEFPAGYDITGAGVSAASFDGSRTVADVGNELVITRTTGGSIVPADTTITLTLSGVKNPPISGSAGTVAISTKTSANVEIDSGNASAVTLTPGAITSGSVVLADDTNGATTAATVTGTNSNPWPANGKISITFPADFDVSSATFTGGTPADGTFTLGISGQTLTVTRTGDGTDTPAGAFSVSLGMIVNPATAGTTGTFALQSASSGNVVIDQGSAPGVDIQ